MLFPSLSLAQMEALARYVGSCLRKGDIVTFSGDLGAGKTSFARELIRSLSAKNVQVTSPTFVIMQSYDVKLADGSPEQLWHLDLYRIKNEKEVQELGLEEIWPHVTLIEWPDIIKNTLSKKRLDIVFNFVPFKDSRKLSFTGDDYWQEKLQSFEETA